MRHKVHRGESHVVYAHQKYVNQLYTRWLTAVTQATDFPHQKAPPCVTVAVTMSRRIYTLLEIFRADLLMNSF